MGLTLVMLALLLVCYALCALLVSFAENVIRPRCSALVDAADLPHTDTSQQTGLQ